MKNRTLFTLVIVLASCQEHNIQRNDKLPNPIYDSISNNRYDTNINNIDTLTTNRKEIKNTDSILNCKDILYSFVAKSTFSPMIKKVNYGIWVDTVSKGVAILKITIKMLNAMRMYQWAGLRLILSTKSLWI